MINKIKLNTNQNEIVMLLRRDCKCFSTFLNGKYGIFLTSPTGTKRIHAATFQKLLTEELVESYSNEEETIYILTELGKTIDIS